MATQKLKKDSKIKGLLFDLDGTLVDSYLPIMQGLNHVRTYFGLTGYSLDEVKKMVGRGLETLIGEAVGKDHIKEGVSLFRKKYKTIFIEKTKLLPDVRAVTTELFKRGYTMGVASNKPSYFTTEILKSQNIHDFFKVVLGPDDVQQPKPDPEMIDKAIENLQLSKSEVLYVGDMVLDIETGRRAGIKVCVIPAGSSTRKELEEAHPDRILDHFKELKMMLPRLREGETS